MRLPLKQLFVSALVLAATSGAAVSVASSGSCRGGDADWAGKYRLTGIMGIGSTLSLKSDGSFKYNLTYGALKQRGEGCWTQQGQTIALLPDGETKMSNGQTLDDIRFHGLELQARDDGALVWDIADSGRKAVYQRR